ncbi:MAG: hypothetical protein ACRCZP_12555, partial [Phycicoccus sp.]
MGDAMGDAYRVLAVNPGLVTDLAARCSAASSTVEAITVTEGAPTGQEWLGADGDAARSVLSARAAGLSGLGEGVAGVGDILEQYAQVVVAAQQRARYAIELYDLGQERVRWAVRTWPSVTDLTSARLVRDQADRGSEETLTANLEAARSAQLVRDAGARAAWAIQMMTELLRNGMPETMAPSPSGWSEIGAAVSKAWSGLPGPVRGVGNLVAGVGEGFVVKPARALADMTVEAFDFSDTARSWNEMVAAWRDPVGPGSAGERRAAREELFNRRVAEMARRPVDQVSAAAKDVWDAVDPALAGADRQAEARRVVVGATIDGVRTTGRAIAQVTGVEDVVQGAVTAVTGESDQVRQAGLRQTGQGLGTLGSFVFPNGKAAKGSPNSLRSPRGGSVPSRATDDVILPARVADDVILPAGGSSKLQRWSELPVKSPEARNNQVP